MTDTPDIQDTIAAISTPIGEGGIGIVRLSGPDAILIADKVFSSHRKRPDNRQGNCADNRTENRLPGKSLSLASTHTITYGFALNSAGKRIDEVLVSVMRSPHSYTRQDVVEINCHGGPTIVRRVLESILAAGARLANPGEFTLRAFLNGRIDLAQAESVMDLINARTGECSQLALAQLRGGLSRRIDALKDEVLSICAYVEASIDFPEEEFDPEDNIETIEADGADGTLVSKMHGVMAGLRELADSYDRGRYFREGLSIAIVGKPNVGKSSLLNALLQSERAIVTPIAGTTRDTIEESLNIDGLPVTIVDTAGIRASHDAIEKEGIARSLAAIDGARIVLPVFDGSEPPGEGDDAVMEAVMARMTEPLNGKRAIVVLNKADLSASVDGADFCRWLARYGGSPTVVRISAKTGEGLGRLRKTIYDVALNAGSGIKEQSPETGQATPDEAHEGALVTNIRHKGAIVAAMAALDEAAKLIAGKKPLEIAAIELRKALDSLGEITGAVTTTDILNKIFSDFCIGK
ncbi:MAG: tRNA uridine-5-carboxymethylaminomethyl(34) synthesis GTPase MnmE [Nitrospirae bacterium]|nr:tRNA uridine-5-carboxymethylaminomethyl(34) synthesis GTPase MnmE [Nitrospirota bacterium]